MRTLSLAGLVSLTLLAGCDDLQWLLDDPAVPPDPPVLSEVESPTRVPRVGVGGNKPAGTGVLVGDEVVVALDGAVLFGFLLDLAEGEQTYEVRTFDSADRRSDPVTFTVDLDLVPPAPPTLDPVAAFTTEGSVTLTGTKEAGTSLWASGAEALPLGGDVSFSLTRPLASGENIFRLATQDAVGNESDVVVVTIARVGDLDMTPPPAPVLDPVPALSTTPSLALSGALAEAGDVLVNGLVVLEDAPAGAFTALAIVPLGVVELDVRARDPAGNVSDPVSPAPVLYVNPAGLVFAVDPLPAVALASPVTVTGVRGGDVDVFVNGLLAAPADGQPTFGVEVPLASGTNELVVEGRAGPASASVMLSVSLDAVGPLPPVLDETDVVTDAASLSITGQRAPGTAVLRGMVEVVPPGPDPVFADDVIVEEGVTALRYALRDVFGRVSPEVVVTVSYLPAPSDAGPLDGGPLDAGPLDAGPFDDGGPDDGGPDDGGPDDGGPDDGGPDDGGPDDGGAIDAGEADAGPADAGPGDGGP